MGDALLYFPPSITGRSKRNLSLLPKEEEDEGVSYFTLLSEGEEEEEE